jgi:hypothetical protein
VLSYNYSLFVYTVRYNYSRFYLGWVLVSLRVQAVPPPPLPYGIAAGAGEGEGGGGVGVFAVQSSQA